MTLLSKCTRALIFEIFFFWKDKDSLESHKEREGKIWRKVGLLCAYVRSLLRVCQISLLTLVIWRKECVRALMRLWKVKMFSKRTLYSDFNLVNVLGPWLLRMSGRIRVRGPSSSPWTLWRCRSLLILILSRSLFFCFWYYQGLFLFSLLFKL